MDGGKRSRKPVIDPGPMNDLADRAISDAMRAAISPPEIGEEVGSLFAVMVEAVENQHRGG
ncbi:DUF768 domain-containing protein [Mesorhizobium sp. B2-3-5]|nr:DUF768 domain-containing protein [Mesorhizobium sp. B2-3-5]